MKEKLEEKTFPFEIKAINDEGTFEGYAAVFNKEDLYGETIEEGAFTKTLREKKEVPVCWYHDPRDVLGIAQLKQDEKGLKVKGDLNLEVQSAREKFALMKQKAVRGLSIGFRTVKDSWEGRKRFIKEAKLFEISPCTFPIQVLAQITQVKSESEKTFEGAIEYIKEIKSGRVISADNLKKIDAVIQALNALLKAAEPPKGTPGEGKSGIFSSIVKGLERKEDKPHGHLFGSTLKTLEDFKESTN